MYVEIFCLLCRTTRKHIAKSFSVAVQKLRNALPCDVETICECPFLRRELKRFFLKEPYVISLRLFLFRSFNLDFRWCCKVPFNIRILVLCKSFFLLSFILLL